MDQEIVRQREIADGVYYLEMAGKFSFVPGQVVSVETGGNAPRLYSIASGVNDEYPAILYDVKPEGKVTPLLRRMKTGDKITVSEPFGNFIYGGKKAFWIASGTGIAPFYSMFRSGLAGEITLIHGARKKEQFYFQEEFALQLKPRYIRCCSGESGEGLYAGRLTKHLRETDDLPPGQNYYLCGSSEMVVEVRDILISRDIPYGNIKAEIYF